jgi:tetratricopeptide (TPR) repeat protein
MTIKNNRTIALIILLAVFMLLGIYSGWQYGAVKVREARYRHLRQELRTADAIADDSAAAAAYKKLQPALPEIQLRILQRQWRIAQELLLYMQRARYNVELQNETGVYSGRLKSLLDEMLDRCGSMLADAASLRPDIVWQIYNAAGSAKLLSAFIMLENGQNVDKVQGVVRDALTDYKAAIEAVDKAGAPTFQRNIPRWNFELLNSEQYIKKIEVAITDMEKTQLLKENLETLMPEMGGYAPGEPIETKVKK